MEGFKIWQLWQLAVRCIVISNLVAHLPKLRESFPESSTELAPRSPDFNVGSVIGRIPGSQESLG